MTDRNEAHRGGLAPETAGSKTVPRSRWRWLVKALLPLLIVGVGVLGASYVKNTAPKARKRPPQKQAILVKVMKVGPSTEQVTVAAMGNVIPAREMELKSRVAGEVMAISPDFAEGGFLKAGQEILRLDPQDYRLAVQQKQSAVTRARFNITLEMGQQDVAKRDWEVLNRGKPADPRDLELALRKPHLEKAKADLAAAEADLKQAKLHLSRTRLKAPFNAIVRSENVEVGSQVTVQETVAELVGADAYWIKTSVPVDRLSWIMVPRKAGEKGSFARVFYGDRQDIAGRVIKLLGDMEAEGRMARILIEVDDPLGQGTADERRTPLLIGEYVRVEIEGRKLQDVYRIPRSALRDNGNLWIADADDRLAIRTVETVWRDAETVLLQNGLSSGERLIVSDIPAPVAGMELMVEGDIPDGAPAPEMSTPSKGKG